MAVSVAKAARPKTVDGEVALLKRRITESELTSTDFARFVLTRDPRTVRRWLAGDNPIPERVMDFLVEPWEFPYP
jgi:hypothetical protein